LRVAGGQLGLFEQDAGFELKFLAFANPSEFEFLQGSFHGEVSGSGKQAARPARGPGRRRKTKFALLLVNEGRRPGPNLLGGAGQLAGVVLNGGAVPGAWVSQDGSSKGTFGMGVLRFLDGKRLVAIGAVGRLAVQTEVAEGMAQAGQVHVVGFGGAEVKLPVLVEGLGHHVLNGVDSSVVGHFVVGLHALVELLEHVAGKGQVALVIPFVAGLGVAALEEGDFVANRAGEDGLEIAADDDGLVGIH
jgi:hypothetical protein